MRIRTQLIIADDVIAKIDEIAGEKHRRAIVVETALREYIARAEEKPQKKVVDDKKTAVKKH
jgi:predicted transcriptional regulator